MNSTTKPWWMFTALLVVLILISGIILFNQHQHNLQIATQTATDRFTLFKTSLQRILEEGAYDQIQPVIDEWEHYYTDILLLTLESRNGFKYGESKSKLTTGNRLNFQEKIQYGYRGNATLIYHHDISSVHQQLLTTFIGVCLAFMIVAVFGAQLVNKTVNLTRISLKLNQRNEELLAEHSLLQSVIDYIPDTIYFKSVSGKYSGCNLRFKQVFGLEERQIAGESDVDLFDKDTSKKRLIDDSDVINTGKYHHDESWILDHNGGNILMENFKRPYYDDNGKLLGMIGIGRDVTQLRQNQENLTKLAYHDSLTGLPNRRYLFDRMQLDMANAKRYHRKLAICSIDLDGFKPVNDRYGHEAGDKVLIKIATRLKALLRKEDTVSRWGGDEFTLLLGGANDDTDIFLSMLNRVHESINEDICLDGIDIHLTSSIGITVYPHDNNDPDTLLRHADQAMYLSKQGGKNKYTFFDPEQDRNIHSKVKQISILLSAIDNEELVLHYQPQVNLLTGKLHGVEALVRWQHPEQGLLPPEKFLPPAGHLAANISLDTWVLKTALKQIEIWKKKQLVPQVSVNISALMLQNDGFYEFLNELLNEYPAGKGQLQLEVLETTSFHNIDQIVEIIQDCKKLDVSFALDDFGTGYSSLTYLRRLPAEMIKIDRSFVLDMLNDENDLKIVNGTLKLAEAFGKDTVAEGVETSDHVSMLMKLGCQYVQGFGIAKPMPANEVEKWTELYRIPDDIKKLEFYNKGLTGYL